jgi:acyl carrier protein
VIDRRRVVIDCTPAADQEPKCPAGRRGRVLIMSKESEVEEDVIAVLRTLTPRGTNIERRHRIISDLKLLSDDATAMALDLERRFHLKIPRAEWGTVYTVQDVIDLLLKHMKANTARTD